VRGYITGSAMAHTETPGTLGDKWCEDSGRAMIQDTWTAQTLT
jgi:hypothetical protein